MRLAAVLFVADKDTDLAQRRKTSNFTEVPKVNSILNLIVHTIPLQLCSILLR